MQLSLKIMCLAALIWAGTGCEKAFIEPPESDPEAVFEELWHTFKAEYAPFEERHVDWEAAYRTFRPQVTAQTSDDALFAVLTEMLALLDDGHVTLTAPGRALFTANRIRREHVDDDLFSLPLIKNYLQADYKEGAESSYLSGKVKGANMGYVWFAHVSSNFLILKDFFRENETADGLIIDLRHNDGGDFTWCFSEIGRLTDQERYVFRSKSKNGSAPYSYTPWKEWRIQPKGAHLKIPIVVLTDRYTISAGERAVMAFMTLPQVTVMGDTTNGAHGTMIGRELPNGWFYSVVPQKVEMPDGKSYEGIGLAPEVRVVNSLAGISKGTDMTLEAAIKKLK